MKRHIKAFRIYCKIVLIVVIVISILVLLIEGLKYIFERVNPVILTSIAFFILISIIFYGLALDYVDVEERAENKIKFFNNIEKEEDESTDI